MERLPTVGDLVRFKQHCAPAGLGDCIADIVYLVSEQWGGFLRLHGEHGMIARDNFEIISEVPKED